MESFIKLIVRLIYALGGTTVIILTLPIAGFAYLGFLFLVPLMILGYQGYIMVSNNLTEPLDDSIRSQFDDYLTALWFPFKKFGHMWRWVITG